MTLQRGFRFFLHTIFLIACQPDSSERHTATAPTIVPAAKPVPAKPAAIVFDRALDDAAKVMAGMPVKGLLGFTSICQSEGWRRCAAAMDSSWSQVERQRFSRMKAWRDTELAAAQAATNVLYPFSGPDFIHAHTLFPNATNYHLFGLEPIGSLPDFARQSPNEVVNYCEAVQKALRDVFRRSYFLTKRMHHDLPRINGAVPLICVFLVRTGNTITRIQPMMIAKTGQPMDWKGADTGLPKNTPRLVRIEFLDGQTHARKSVYYYAGDLSDAGLQARPAVAEYLTQLPGNCAGYLKSASYLLHYASFSAIRNSMLQKCQTLLQDDTGIAYEYFDMAAWNIQLYGVYLPPIAEFKNRHQTELQQMYRDSAAVRPLPFDLGYHWGTHKDNLLWAVRKKG